MRITHWGVKNYKSILDESLELDDTNILIGKNNSGKSAIIDSLSDYRSLITDGINGRINWIEERVTGKELEKNITFHIRLRLSNKEYADLLRDINKKGVANTGIEKLKKNQSLER